MPTAVAPSPWWLGLQRTLDPHAREGQAALGFARISLADTAPHAHARLHNAGARAPCHHCEPEVTHATWPDTAASGLGLGRGGEGWVFLGTEARVELLAICVLAQLRERALRRLAEPERG